MLMADDCCFAIITIIIACYLFCCWLLLCETERDTGTISHCVSSFRAPRQWNADAHNSRNKLLMQIAE